METKNKVLKVVQFRVGLVLYKKGVEKANELGISIAKFTRDVFIAKINDNSTLKDIDEKPLRKNVAGESGKEQEVKQKINKANSPFISADFLQFVVWIYFVREDKYDNRPSLEAIKYYFAILQKYIDYLDFNYKIMFLIIYNDLVNVIDESKPWKSYFYIKSLTGSGSNQFNFELFKSMILVQKMQ